MLSGGERFCPTECAAVHQSMPLRESKDISGPLAEIAAKDCSCLSRGCNIRSKMYWRLQEHGVCCMAPCPEDDEASEMERDDLV